MSEDVNPDPDNKTDLELLTLGGAQQVALSLVQLIEAKALAQRLVFKALVQELSAAAGPEVAARIQARLDALQLDPALGSQKDNDLQHLVVQELSHLVDTLDDVVAHPERPPRDSSAKES